MLISNAAFYCLTPITGWFVVTPIDLSNELTAFKFDDGTFASARADGSIQPKTAIGPNESFTLAKNGTAYAIIGEGPRVIAVVE